MVVDLRAAYARYLAERGEPFAQELSALRMPGSVAAFLEGGERNRAALHEVTPWAVSLAGQAANCGLRGETLFMPLEQCRLHAPVRLAKLIAVRFPREGMDSPRLVMKPAGTVVGPTRNVIVPHQEARLRFSPGLGVVIGKRCKSLAENKARAAVAGYTVMSEFQVADGPDAADPFTCAMFESFAPSGPWLTLADTVEPEHMRVSGSVNGARVDDYRLADLPWSLHRIVAFLSRMGLDPGDTIWLGREPENEQTLGLDDAATASVSGIGEISNRLGLHQPSN